MKLIPPVIFGKNCKIGKGVTLGPRTVLGDGSILGDGAEVFDFVALGATELPANQVSEGALQFEKTILCARGRA